MKHFYEELANKQINASKEIKKFRCLLTENRKMGPFQHTSLLGIIDAQFFRKIQAKGNCVDAYEFLGFLDGDYGSADAIDQFCQFVERVSTLLRQVKPLVGDEMYGMLEQINTIYELIDEDLHLLDFDLRYQTHPRYGDIAFVCHKSAEAIAAIALAPNETIAGHIFEYLRVLDDANVETKRIQLGELYFGIKPSLDLASHKGITIQGRDHIDCFINNLNIRHPNTNGIGSERTPFLETESDEGLIKAYDALFALLLNAITQLDIANKTELIHEIRKKIKGR